MTEQQKKELIESLLEFAKRASKKDATGAEIAVLPAVAKILLDFKGAY